MKQETIKINNEYTAVDWVLRKLKEKGYKWQHIKYINEGRYCIAYGEPNIAILLKSEPFYKFGEMFNSKGVGDSINCKALRSMIKQNVKEIYVMFKNGYIYNIELQRFLEFSHRWVQKEGTAVRSISIHEYRRCK